MTDMEAKARELWGRCTCASKDIVLCYHCKGLLALTEAHREGMEEAAKVCEPVSGHSDHCNSLCHWEDQRAILKKIKGE